MLAYLSQLAGEPQMAWVGEKLLSVLNVFRYITFRTAGATITAGAFVFLFGPAIIASLKVRQGKGSFGYNAATEEYEDLMKAGIIDPTKVVRTALQNSASVAGLLLTTEAMVAEKPKEEKAAAGGMPHGGEDF